MYKYPGKREESMNTVFHQELMRYNKLLAVIKESLQQIIKTVDGLITINNEVEDSINRIYDNVVPASWQKVSKIILNKLIDLVFKLKNKKRNFPNMRKSNKFKFKGRKNENYFFKGGLSIFEAFEFMDD